MPIRSLDLATGKMMNDGLILPSCGVSNSNLYVPNDSVAACSDLERWYVKNKPAQTAAPNVAGDGLSPYFNGEAFTELRFGTTGASGVTGAASQIEAWADDSDSSYYTTNMSSTYDYLQVYFDNEPTVTIKDNSSLRLEFRIRSSANFTQSGGQWPYYLGLVIDYWYYGTTTLYGSYYTDGYDPADWYANRQFPLSTSWQTFSVPMSPTIMSRFDNGYPHAETQLQWYGRSGVAPNVNLDIAYMKLVYGTPAHV